MESTSASSQQTTTLAAATATPLTFDTSGCKSLCLAIENTGANAIGTTKVEKSPDGTTYAEDAALGAAIGSTASGAAKLVEMTDVAFSRLRITFTSASGSSVRVTLRGT